MGAGTLGDHQTLVRDGFRMILDAQEDIEVVGEAADGLEAIVKATSSALSRRCRSWRIVRG